MTTRYNFKWEEPQEISEPVKEEWELITIIEPISFNEDKTIKEYKEVQKYVCHKTLWKDFIKSFDIGSPSEQVLNHLEKGTPLVTAHTLPDGDYTRDSLLKGAEIKREMDSQGITLDMIVEATKRANAESSAEAKEESEVVANG